MVVGWLEEDSTLVVGDSKSEVEGWQVAEGLD